MTIVIDYQSVAKAPMPGSVLVAGTPKQMSASASAPNAQAAEAPPSREDSALLDPQGYAAQNRTESEIAQLSTDELLNRKLDELREAREANKLKDSEIAMLKKETAWMKKELRQRAEEMKALKATARPAPKKKTAEARPTR